MSDKIVNINDLYEFDGNPYSIRDDEEMEILTESIKKYGIIEPLIVRKRESGGYEILSGHRRKYACEKAGIEQVPVSVRDIDRNMAIITLVDSNLQRENLLPSEKAFAFKMKLEAEKHQGLACGQDVHKSRDKVAEGFYSGRQVQRYVRLTELIKPILNLVDERKIAISPAVELSYLTEKEQNDLLETMESEECTPSHSQAIRMKELSKDGKLDMDTIFDIMTEEKPNQQEKLQFKINNVKQYFPKGYTSEQMYETIKKLLEKYQKNWQRKIDERNPR